jgi:hypothetical protein
MIEGLPVELGPDSQVVRLESGGVGVTDAVLPGFWHLSRNEIAAFADDKITGAASNLGPGTYVGHGALTGDIVRGIREGVHIQHNLNLKGNLLLVPIEYQDDASWEVAELALGEELSGVARMAASKRTNKVLSEHSVGGVKYDGFVYVHWENPNDPTGERRAEGVIFNPERVIQIVDRTVVTPNAKPID